VIEHVGRAGLTAQRIYQDLVAQHGFTGGYDSVRRFLKAFASRTVEPVQGLDVAPAEEAKADLRTRRGSSRRIPKSASATPRIVLNHSREGYTGLYGGLVLGPRTCYPLNVISGEHL